MASALLAAAVVLVAAGCASRDGGAPGEPPASNAPSITPPTPTPTAEPTPEPTPDPVALLVQNADRNDYAVAATFAGTQQIIGGAVIPVSGAYLAVGDAFEVSVDWERPEGDERTEQRYVDGRSYVRTGDDIWYQVDAETITGSFATVLREATWRARGVDVGGIAITSPNLNLTALAGNLGLLTSQMTGTQTDEVTGTVSLVISDTGSPVSLGVELVHDLTMFGESLMTLWTLEYDFTDPDADAVEAPDQAWRAHQMVEEGYIAHVPAEWELDPRTPDYDWDVFFDPVTGDEVQFSRLDRMAGAAPDELFAYILDEVVASRADQTLERSQRITVSGFPALVTAGTRVDAGEEYFVMDLFALEGDWLHMTTWYFEPGQETEDEKLVAQMLDLLILLPSRD